MLILFVALITSLLHWNCCTGFLLIAGVTFKIATLAFKNLRNDQSSWDEFTWAYGWARLSSPEPAWACLSLPEPAWACASEPYHGGVSTQQTGRLPHPFTCFPRHIRQSPRHIRQSPRHIRQSPRHIRQSPRHIRQSPRHIRQSSHPSVTAAHPSVCSLWRR